MSDHQQLREQREALVEAVNRHDLEGVQSFIHPSFVGKNKSGSTVAGYQETVGMLEQLLAPATNYDEIVEIEDIEMSDDCANLMLRRLARGLSQNRQGFTILMAVALVNTFNMLLIFQQGRLAHWEGVIGLLVLAALIWFACYVKRRSYYEDSRARETWRLIDGRWMLAEEQQL